MPLTSASPDAQTLQAIRSGACFGVLDGYCLLKMEGPDIIRFLQNQTTQDIQGISEGGYSEAAAVDRNGKLQGVFTLYRIQPDRFLALIEASQSENLLDHFSKYKLFDQFTLEQLPEYPYVLLGPKAIDLKALLEKSKAPKSPTFQIRWAGLDGVLLLESQEQAEEFSESLAKAQQFATPLTKNIQEALRIEAGIPKFGIDMDNQTLFPETGLHEESVSYTKGCYLGQEVIAKVKTYGRLPKALAGITFPLILNNEEASKLLGTSCLDNEKPVGTVTSILTDSSLGSTIALAYLGREHRTPGQQLQVGEHTVIVTTLPFIAGKSQPKAQRESLLHEALHAFAEGNDDVAIGALEELLNNTGTEVDHVDIQATEALGVIYGRLNQVDKAIECMHNLLKYDPDSIMAHTNLSIFHLKQGNKELAEEEKAKATIAGMRQKAKEAGVDFKKLDEEREKREQEKLKQLEERITLFQQALAYSPDDPLGNYGLGSALLELRRHAEAIEPLQRTINAQPGHSVAHLMLGKAFEAVGEKENAISIYEKGIQVAASKGDRMPLDEMQQRLSRLR